MKYSVLIVDDDFMLLDFHLKSHQSSITLTLALNGVEATSRLLFGLQPHLLIVDAFMPLMDGYELLVWLKGSPTYQHLPVIMWADDLSSSQKAGYYKAGTQSIILKQEALGQGDAFYHYCLGLIQPS